MKQQPKYSQNNINLHDGLDDAYNSLSTEDKSIVDEITKSVNMRIAVKTGMTTNKWTIAHTWILSGVFLVLISLLFSYLLLEYENHTNLSRTSKQNNAKATTILSKKTKSFVTEKKPISENIKTEGSNLSNTEENNDAKEVNTTIPIVTDTSVNTTNIYDKLKDAKNESKNKLKDEEKATNVELEVISVEILGKRMIYDIEKNSSSNTDVTNPNIGHSTSKGIHTYDPKDMPKFHGGDDALKTLINKEIDPMRVINDIAAIKTCVIQFYINHKGNAEDITIMSSVSPKIDNEVVQVINNLPLWSSGKKKWRIEYVISITFE